MERYWKLMFTSCLFVFGIGFFYLHDTFAEKELPEYTWEKQKGNDDVLEDVLVQAYIQDGSYIEETIQIAGEKSKYASQLSFLETLNGAMDNLKIKQLQQEYRGFMRGKTENTYNFYEDEQLLAYADVTSEWDSSQFEQSNFTLEVETVSKRDDKTTSFSIKLPNQDQYNYVDVGEVTVLGDKLHVLTQNDLFVDGTNKSEMRLYTIDLTNEKLISEQSLFSDKGKSTKGDREVILLHDTDELQANKYIAVLVREFDEDDEKKRLQLFDIKKQEEWSVDVPKKMLEQEVIADMRAETFYFIYEQKGKLSVTPYLFAEQQLDEPIEIPISDAIDVNMMKYTKIIHDKLYLFYDMNSSMGGESNPSQISGNPPLMYVIDLKDKALRYEGELTPKNEAAKNAFIMIESMYENEQ
ncbi:hypothetical protein CAI16_19480 [Virgibacillus dokdonensis]|uniref:Uncharacterized protein n=1 Tax=Virgibacillus dokdonensis TaxID=302167 RepID=A0A3E0WIA8_9BACI|nr:hypothetical protein [Virgibacillus dokdonensis]RFA31953.1 hypothetical protein CAI16_19480 [Virgibacillus dokdonensis]